MVWGVQVVAVRARMRERTRDEGIKFGVGAGGLQGLGDGLGGALDGLGGEIRGEELLGSVGELVRAAAAADLKNSKPITT